MSRDAGGIVTTPTFTLEAMFRVRCDVDGCRWNQAHNTQEAAVADAREHLQNWHAADVCVGCEPCPECSCPVAGCVLVERHREHHHRTEDGTKF